MFILSVLITILEKLYSIVSIVQSNINRMSDRIKIKEKIKKNLMHYRDILNGKQNQIMRRRMLENRSNPRVINRGRNYATNNTTGNRLVIKLNLHYPNIQTWI